jgi:DNA-binding CsgD family transcriptional regulator
VARRIGAFVTGRAGDESRRGRPAPPAEGAPLSPRELEVVALVAAGDSNAEIAHRLGISINTVERHVGNVYRKIDARGRADATAWAIRNGLA